MDKDLQKQKMLYLAALIEKEYNRLAMQPWKPGYITPDQKMTAKAAIVANCAIGRMMRCE